MTHHIWELEFSRINRKSVAYLLKEFYPTDSKCYLMVNYELTTPFLIVKVEPISICIIYYFIKIIMPMNISLSSIFFDSSCDVYIRVLYCIVHLWPVPCWKTCILGLLDGNHIWMIAIEGLQEWYIQNIRWKLFRCDTFVLDYFLKRNLNLSTKRLIERRDTHILLSISSIDYFFLVDKSLAACSIIPECGNSSSVGAVKCHGDVSAWI